MKYSSLVQRISGESVDAWEVHYKAMQRLDNGEDIYLLSVGQESTEYTDDVIVDSAIDSLKKGRHHYTQIQGERRLRQLIVEQHNIKTAQQVDEDNCVVFSGTQNGLFATAQCLLEKGDEVMVFEPYYTTYPGAFTSSGATLVPVKCDIEDNFQINVERVIQATTDKTRAIVINSPNNPTGAIYEARCIEKIVKHCLSNKIWLISDEVYAQLVEPPTTYTSPASFDPNHEVVVCVSSVSKSHRMTGWRLGWVIAPKALCQHFYNLNICMSYGMPGFIQDAAITALENSSQIIPKVIEKINSRRLHLENELAKINDIVVVPAQAGMFVMIDIRNLNIQSQQFCLKLLDAYNVAVLPCDGFGESCKGLIRISACESRQRLSEACEKISTHINSMRY